MYVSLLLAMIQAGAAAPAAGDPRAVPVHERLETLNRWMQAAAPPGESANAHYERAFAVFVGADRVAAPDDDPSELPSHDWLGDNLKALALTLDWPPEREALVREWIARNESALAAAAAAVQCPRFVLGVTARDNRVAAEDTVHQAVRFRKLDKLLAVRAAFAAETGDWAAAYEWNLHQHRLAAHMRTTPFWLWQRSANLQTERAYQQFLVFLNAHPPGDSSALLGAAARLRAQQFDTATQGRIDDLMAWDEIELAYAWAAAPARYPAMQDAAEGMLLLKHLLADGTSDLTPADKAKVDELRRAMLLTTPESAWAVRVRLGELWDALSPRPLHEQLRDLPTYRTEYVKIAADNPFTAFFYRDSIVRPEIGLKIVADMEMYAAAAETSAAIFAFRAANHGWPKRLAELTPKFVSALPLDPYSGAPLCYRLNEDRSEWKLWSVGPDRKDGGGNSGGERVVGVDEPVPEGDIVFWPPKSEDIR